MKGLTPIVAALLLALAPRAYADPTSPTAKRRPGSSRPRVQWAWKAAASS